MLAEEIQEYTDAELFRNYSGEALWHIVRILYSVYSNEEQLPLPQYVKLSHPEAVEQQEKEPTAKDIINGVLEKLG